MIWLYKLYYWNGKFPRPWIDEDLRQKKNKVPIGQHQPNSLHLQEQEDPAVHDPHLRQDQS